LSVIWETLLDFVFPKNLNNKEVGISKIFHFIPNIANYPSKSGLNFIDTFKLYNDSIYIFYYSISISLMSVITVIFYITIVNYIGFLTINDMYMYSS